MRQVTSILNCPICDEKPTAGHIVKAVISPWIRELGIRKQTSEYVMCPNCEVGYFSYRYSAREMSAIYSEYRGAKYLQIRSQWEPWYSDIYNSNHDDESYISTRRNVLHEFIVSRVRSEIESAVDVGGDRGQYIPNFPDAAKFVLEVSNKEPVNDVKRIESLDDLQKVDLIMYSHVLEHVVDPVGEISKLIDKASYVYVEVPYGVPIITNPRKSRPKFLVHLLSSHSKKAWRRQAKPATSRIIPQNRILTQSEHINFFSENSLKQIADKLDLELQTNIGKVFTPDFSEGTVIQCLFSKGSKI